MELRTYAQILRRRWWLALIPTIVVLVIGLVTYQAPPPAYNVGVRFEVGQFPATEALSRSDEERYYNWLTSEYIVNGLADWVRGNRFGEAVSAELARAGLSVPAGAIQGGLAVDNVRSMLLISLSANDPQLLEEMMAAAVVVLTEQNAVALPQLGGESALLVQLDEPIVNQVPAGLRAQLELPVRVALAVIAGVGLAFLVEYLDPTLRDRLELEALGLRLMGEIPKR
jgi:capsular polysaccharide biosynthesis protein